MRTTSRRTCAWCLSIAVGIGMAGCSGKSEAPPPAQEAQTVQRPASQKRATAAATLGGRSGSQATGKALFTEKDGKVTLHLLVRNLPPGTHAVHIHETGDCSDPEAKSAGAHWNPTGAPHGRWGGTCHMGDIGNIEVNDHGDGILTLTTDLWTIGGGPGSDILGKAVIVHAQADDFATQPTGNAGGRIACGVIRAES